MDRYPANSSAAGQTLRKTFLASDPAFVIPLWARTGKCFIRATGVGAGASGSLKSTNSGVGEGGGAGAVAIDMPIIIPAGTVSISIAIGVGGAPVTGQAALTGNKGGSTTLTVGTATLILQGGNAGHAQAAAAPSMLDTAGVPRQMDAALGGLVGSMPNCYQGVPGLGSGSGIGSGAGGPSPFGVSGNGLLAAIGTASVNGTNATGYGAGGSGGAYSTSNATSGRGAPGLLMIVIEE